MKRIGLMGCGTVATYGHLPAIVATEGLTLAALFDPDPVRLATAAEAFGRPACHTDLDGFFAEGLDGVVVTSLAAYHPENVAACAAHGLPVLCEKPLALTEPEVEGMIAAMDAAGQPLYTGFCYRFSPVAQTIKRLVAAEAIGQVRALRLVYIWNCHGQQQRTPEGELTLNLRRHHRLLDEGPMVDCGVHQIDLARWWLGAEVVAQRAAGAWIDDYELPDHVWLHLDHAGGAHTMVEMSFSYGHTAAQPQPVFGYTLIGTEGVIHYDREARRFEVRNAAGTQQLHFDEEKSFEGMYAAYAHALETGEDADLPTARDGLIATRIASEGTAQAQAARGLGVRS